MLQQLTYALQYILPIAATANIFPAVILLNAATANIFPAVHITICCNCYYISRSTYYQLLQLLIDFLQYLLPIALTAKIFPAVHITNCSNSNIILAVYI